MWKRKTARTLAFAGGIQPVLAANSQEVPRAETAPASTLDPLTVTATWIERPALYVSESVSVIETDT
jgi:hypothetical protein